MMPFLVMELATKTGIYRFRTHWLSLILHRRRASQQVLGAKILTEIGPVDEVPPAGSQRERWSGEASSRRGNQASGTKMLRPSINTTVSVSVLTWTWRTRSPV